MAPEEEIDVVGDDDDEAYRWEESIKRPWDEIQEDETGSIANAVSQYQIQQYKRQRREVDGRLLKRSIIRHLVVVLDMSQSMDAKDLQPSRLAVTLKLLDRFITEFSDQNPISQMSIVATNDATAFSITDLGGNPSVHRAALREKVSVKGLKSEPSLQISLEIAKTTLRFVDF
eukprot:NODE_213_length_1893_cov_43.177237_g189_i0.p2 GENE.NODE_213_length_1893_cov_43.177237_g189_i0~~NODE_213_length_1893_cov_43.177237_g189_i0.p2  ORF type:complete len:173 (-),score=20.62 NODE_213_length_1893_cov_43.177237_g189_i0:1043-1561(-)